MNLYAHQRREVDDHGLERFRGLLWCPRSGKSRATLASALRMRREGLIDRMVIVSPNGVHENWCSRELIPILTEHRVWQWETSRAVTESRRLLTQCDRQDFAVYSLPVHIWTLPQARWLLQWIKTVASRTLLVLDESDDYASPSAKRSRRARLLAQQCAAVRILTGTPWHDSILNAWAQLEMLGKETSGYARYTDFSRRYGQWETRFGSHGSFPALIGYQHVDELMSRARKHCSIITAADIPDMPRTANRLINMDLSVTGVKDMATLRAKHADENPGVLFGKIHQLVSLDTDRLQQTVQLARRHKYVVIWCRYREDVEALKDRMPDAWTLYGGTTPQVRRHIRETLCYDATTTDPMVLLAQPQACSRGLDFSRAEAMIFHSHLPSGRMHAQALERATAIGAGTTPVYYICNSGIDAYIIQRLRTKTRFARITLQDLEELDEYNLVPKEERLRRLWKNMHSVDLRQL